MHLRRQRLDFHCSSNMRFDTSWAGLAVDYFGGFMRSFCISAFSRTGFTRHTKNTWKLAYLFLLLLLLPGNQLLHGQAIGGGQIQGTVTDETGSAVAGATLEAVQTESGLH